MAAPDLADDSDVDQRSDAPVRARDSERRERRRERRTPAKGELRAPPDDPLDERVAVMVSSSPPRLALAAKPDRASDDDDSDDDELDSGANTSGPPAAASARRARRRPRVEHVSTPPMPADDDDDDDDDEDEPTRGAKADGSTAKKPKAKARSKKSARKTPTDRMAHLPFEIAGVVLLALAVLSLLSLVSYHSADTAVGHHGPVKNWIGPGGALVADVLTLVFGFGALLLPGLFAVLTVMCFRPVRHPRNAAVRLAGAVCAGLASLMLFHLVFRASIALPFPAGGLLGAALANGLSSLIAPLGTLVVSVATLFVGALLALDRPVGPTTVSLGEWLMTWAQRGRERLEVWREERRLLLEEDERLRSELNKQAANKPDPEDERRRRIEKRAEARAKERLAAQLESEANFDHYKNIEVAPVGPSAPPVVSSDVLRAPTHIMSTPSAPGTVIEDQPVVHADPPWVLDEPVVDGDALSLAKVLSLPPRGAQPQDGSGDEGLVIHERINVDAEQIERAADEPALVAAKSDFVLPPLNLLDYDAPAVEPIDEVKMRAQADKLIAKFKDFGIDGRIREIRPGPVCTTYELVPAPGIKVSKIAALADDIAMAMEAIQVRIVAPIPGKGAVGIEIPNERRETVYMKEIIADPAFKKIDHKLMMALGKDIEGRAYYANLAEMPHVLISGTTGSGKSVSVNAMICSMLYRATPEDVRFLMIDPKMLELSIYDGIPHLLLPPIIDSKKAAVALRWAVQEMERRYQLMSELGVRDMAGFNTRVLDAQQGTDPDAKRILTEALKGKPIEKLPFIVIVVDEYADLLAVAGKDVEGYIMRLAQKARAAGLHVMLATQRPSVDVITGVIKANFPVRMGFRLASSHDSKTIINRPGAEKLLGRGDMLFMPPGTSNVVRVHGAFISEKELHRVVDHLKQQRKPNYDMDILTAAEAEEGEAGEMIDEPKDARYDEAVAVVARTRKCSTSWLQRMMNLGYQRAARIVDRMEREGLVGPAQNAKGDRDIFVKPEGAAPAG